MSKKRWGTWGHDDREDDSPWKKRKEPERLIEVNSINLTAEALIRDSEELEYYYHNHDVGQIVKDVLQSTNIYK